MSVQVPDQRPQILPVTRRMPTINDAIVQLSDTLSGQQQAQQQQQDARAKQVKDRADALNAKAAEMKLTPDQWREVRAKILASDPEVAQYMPDMPTYTPSADQNFNGMVTDSNIATFPGLPQSVKQGIAGRAASGADLPASQTAMLNAQDIYKNKPAWATEMQRRQQVMDKTALDAGQVQSGQQNARDFSAIKLPESKQKISGEQTTQAKVRAETTGINATNNMMGLGGTGLPGSGTDTGVSPIADAIANRQYSPILLRGLIARNPAYAQELERQVKLKDPTFSMANYDAYLQAKKSFAAGGLNGQNITAVNTALRHSNSLMDDLSKMDNTRSPAWNAVANFVGEQGGNTNVQQYAAATEKDATAVANEMNKAFRGSSQLSEKDTAAWKEGLGRNTAPAAGKGAIGAGIKLLAGRVAELAQTYKRDVGGPMPDFLQGARPILKKFKALGIDGVDELLAVADSGGAAVQPGATAAQTYKQTATGPGGHKIGSNDGTSWFDLETGRPVQ